MSRRTTWTASERDAFVEWHESVIAQYPADTALELRRARDAFLGKVKVI